MPGLLTIGDGLFHSLHGFGAVGRAEDDARADLLGLVRLKLRVAAAHGEHRSGIFVAQAADRLAGFAPALGRDGAGVDDHRVGDLARGGGPVPVAEEDALHGLGLILVDLAAESRYNIDH